MAATAIAPPIIDSVLDPDFPAVKDAIVICHCTTVHTQLKSRSFHRQFVPLVREGFAVRYVAPGPRQKLPKGFTLVSVPAAASAIRQLIAWPKLFLRLIRQSAAVYHFQDPQLLPLAIILKLGFRKRVVYDAYEDFPAMAAAKVPCPRAFGSAAGAVMRWVEAFGARVFDAVITADPLTLRRLARHSRKKKIVFYNFPNLDFFPEPRPRPTNFDLVYRGGISERTGAFVLLEALRILASRPNPPRLLLVGYFDGANGEESFRRRVGALGLNALVEIRGRIDHERMAEELSQARIGLSPLLNARKFQINIPVKIFEYWACGIPAIASDLPPIRPFFRSGEAGLLVEPGRPAGLAQAIASLLNNPELAAGMGQRGRRLVVQRFNNSSEVRKLRRLFLTISEQTGGVHHS